MTIIGIDPGQSGGIALLTEGYVAIAHKMPETPADVLELLETFRHDGPAPGFAYLERVHAMPKQGIASTAKFMRGVGVIEGILTALKIPFEEVTPQKWQKAMGCLTGGDKSISKRKAQQLFPHIKMTHALADCLLLAEYGRRIRCGSTESKSPSSTDSSTPLPG